MLKVIILSLNTILSWVMKAALIGLFIFAIVERLNLITVVTISIALIFSFLPSILNRSYQVNLPWIIDFFVTLYALLHTVGITFNFYHRPPIDSWWDKGTHLLGTAVVAMLGFLAVFTLNFVKKVKMSIPMIGFFTFVFALALGAVWEVVEFYSDKYLGTISAPGLGDTIEDLVFDMIGGGVAAIFGMLYVRRQSRKSLSKSLKPVARILIGK